MAQIKVRRAKDLPRVTRIATSAYTREFPENEDEFIITEQELPYIMHDGNMEFVERIEDAEPPAETPITKDIKQP